MGNANWCCLGFLELLGKYYGVLFFSFNLLFGHMGNTSAMAIYSKTYCFWSYLVTFGHFCKPCVMFRNTPGIGIGQNFIAICDYL